MVEMLNYPGVPLVGMGSQRLRLGESCRSCPTQSYNIPFCAQSGIPTHCCFSFLLNHKLGCISCNKAIPNANSDNHRIKSDKNPRCFGCNQIGHMLKSCPNRRNRQLQTQPGQPSKMTQKSAKRRERDHLRMATYNAFRAEMAEFPFADVPSAELPNLLPKPSRFSDSKTCSNSCKMLSNKLYTAKQELEDANSKLQTLRQEFDVLKTHYLVKSDQVEDLYKQYKKCSNKLDSVTIENDSLKTYLDREKANRLKLQKDLEAKENELQKIRDESGDYYRVLNIDCPQTLKGRPLMARRPRRQTYRQRGNREPNG